MSNTRLFESDMFSALAGIALLCGCYFVAFWVARIAWALRRTSGCGPRLGAPRVAWAARLLGSAGVMLAFVSPVSAMGAKVGGRPGGTPPHDATPPWDSAPPHEKVPDEGAGALRRYQPWEFEENPLPSTTVLPHRPAESSAPPWSGDDGSSPPRPLRRTGAAADISRKARAKDPGARGRSDHGANTRKPDGSSRAQTGHEPNRRDWTVRSGDTLWDIAAHVLRTEDQARVARYWPAIHRANRDTIGADPSLIFPGQILRLPDEDPR